MGFKEDPEQPTDFMACDNARFLGACRGAGWTGPALSSPVVI